MSDSVSHFHLFRILYTTYDVSHLTCSKRVAGHHIHFKNTHLVGVILHSGIEELHLIPFLILPFSILK